MLAPETGEASKVITPPLMSLTASRGDFQPCGYPNNSAIQQIGVATSKSKWCQAAVPLHCPATVSRRHIRGPRSPQGLGDVGAMPCSHVQGPSGDHREVGPKVP